MGRNRTPVISNDGNFYRFDCAQILTKSKEEKKINPRFEIGTWVEHDEDDKPIEETFEDGGQKFKTLKLAKVGDQEINRKFINPIRTHLLNDEGEEVEEDFLYSLDGEIVSVNHKTYDFEGDTVYKFILTLVDHKNEIPEVYVLEMGMNNANDKLLNQLLNLDPSEPNWVSIVMFTDKNGYASVNVYKNGNNVAWRFERKLADENDKDGGKIWVDKEGVVRPEVARSEQKVGKKVKIITDRTELHEFWQTEIDEFASKLKPSPEALSFRSNKTEDDSEARTNVSTEDSSNEDSNESNEDEDDVPF